MNGFEKLATVIFAAALHELGHITTARLLRVRLRGFRMSMCGVVMDFDFFGRSYFAELLVHLSGAFAGFLAAFAAYFLFGEKCDYFIGINAAFSAINLLPIRSLDGGGALLSLLSVLFLPDTAYKIYCAVSRLVSVILLALVIVLELRGGVNIGLLLFSLLLCLHELPEHT